MFYTIWIECSDHKRTSMQCRNSANVTNFPEIPVEKPIAWKRTIRYTRKSKCASRTRNSQYMSSVLPNGKIIDVNLGKIAVVRLWIYVLQFCSSNLCITISHYWRNDMNMNINAQQVILNAYISNNLSLY